MPNRKNWNRPVPLNNEDKVIDGDILLDLSSLYLMQTINHFFLTTLQQSAAVSITCKIIYFSHRLRSVFLRFLLEMSFEHFLEDNLLCQVFSSFFFFSFQLLLLLLLVLFLQLKMHSTVWNRSLWPLHMFPLFDYGWNFVCFFFSPLKWCC